MIIVDTGFWLGLANRHDSYHTQAIMVLANLNEPLITTWPVVTETCYLLSTRIGDRAQVSFIIWLFFKTFLSQSTKVQH
ncbi:type II toxin-antitoxin system VapC family toxin [Nostoc sp.]|uniref:type II toxin-antitoxin system VapC family toxin n=1 Tax=Nostoc sp. TaxID=1180 RepID=UPI002FF508CC